MKTVGAPLRPRLFVACFPLLIALSHTVTPALLVGVKRWEAMGTTLLVSKRGKKGVYPCPLPSKPMGRACPPRATLKRRGEGYSPPRIVKNGGEGQILPAFLPLRHVSETKKKEKKGRRTFAPIKGGATLPVGLKNTRGRCSTSPCHIKRHREGLTLPAFLPCHISE